MKRFAALALFIALLLSAVAMAEGQLTVVEKNVVIQPEDGAGYFYARIENTGDAPVIYDYGQLVILSEEEEILETESYVTCSPSRLVLQPGEYAYVVEYLWNSAFEDAQIGEVKFTVTAGDRWGTNTAPAPCEATVDDLAYDQYIYVTFTNDTEGTVYGYYVVVALHDREGNLVYVDGNQFTNLGVHPGSVVTLKFYVNSDLIEYYKANGITVDSVEALVYRILED